MVTDKQVRKLMEQMQQGKSLSESAIKAGIDEKTARKYLLLRKLPSECRSEHNWRTRIDPFEDVWDEIKKQLNLSPGLQAKTIFDDLVRRYPGRYSDGQLRTLQRKVKEWRAIEGPAKEVFFPQEHHPGDLCESDFSHMDALGVTIQRERFDHLLYHFVLTYSNWETGTICYSESLESLSMGLQNALWELGGVPKRHRTDRLTAAVQKPDNPREFTKGYESVISHYGLSGEKIQAGKANENGDVEQRHHRIKQAIDQALLLRGSRDFNSLSDYAAFIRQIFDRLNAGRRLRLSEELKVLHPLPACRLEACTKIEVKVGPSSTIRVRHNTYSVHSRLIREKVQVRIYAEHLEVWYGQRLSDKLPRLRGENQHRIDYRHIIDWLIRKPGAFENYKYRDDMFPTSRFRMAYDALREQNPMHATKEYLKILHLSAMETEQGVDDALRLLHASGDRISAEIVEAIVLSGERIPPVTDVDIMPVDLSRYDELLGVG